MIAFPNAKINIGLYVTEKRPDGFHNLETLFYPIPLSDILEVIPSEKEKFSFSGIPIPQNSPDQNLIYKAYQLIKHDFDIPPVEAHLHKIIPMGAGLGGGSSNATAMLKLLNQVFSLQVSDKQLFKYAAQLGSDCPFFVLNKPAYCFDRGTNLSSTNCLLEGYYITVWMPENVHISTKKAFQNINPHKTTTPLTQKIKQSIENWKTTVNNDFEDYTFRSYPAIAKIKERAYDAGALYASMSGSGAAVYAISDKQSIRFPAEKYRVKTVFSGKISSFA